MTDRDRLIEFAKKYKYNGMHFHLHGLYVFTEEQLVEIFVNVLKGGDKQ